MAKLVIHISAREESTTGLEQCGICADHV